MGIDLKPKCPHCTWERAGMEPELWGRYNWTGWGWLQNELDKVHSNIKLPMSNDDDFIPAETCEQIANILSFVEPDEANHVPKEWLDCQIRFWRNCHGCWVH